MSEPAELDDETKEIVLESTKHLFPQVTDTACFREVFESFNWDLESSISALRVLFDCSPSSSDTNSSPTISKNVSQEQSTVICTTPDSQEVPKYSSVIKAASAQPSTKMSKTMKKEKLIIAYEEAIRLKNPVQRIAKYMENGIKVMIIMRGCSGSGKSFFVDQLATNLCQQFCSSEVESISHHVFSADDFWIFPETGKYIFNAEYIEYAHLWNQRLVQQAAVEGRSPLFIDNTHTRLWEMKAVATIAIENGYVIEILEPPNKWIFNESELLRRNVHGVHKEAIRKMLARYEPNIKPTLIMSKYGLSYAPHFRPPQRCVTTFNNPPSKNYLKIFNNRFYSAPSLDVIFSLKTEQGTYDLNNHSAGGGIVWARNKYPDKEDARSGSINRPELNMPPYRKGLGGNSSRPPVGAYGLTPLNLPSFMSNNSASTVSGKVQTTLQPPSQDLHFFQELEITRSSSSEASPSSLDDKSVNLNQYSSSSATSEPTIFRSDFERNELSVGDDELRSGSGIVDAEGDVGKEFVMVKPSGALVFHKEHPDCPSTRFEFVKESSLLGEKDLARKSEVPVPSGLLDQASNASNNVNTEMLVSRPQPETSSASQSTFLDMTRDEFVPEDKIEKSDAPKFKIPPLPHSLLQKKYDFGTNTNYEDFDIVKKVNSGQLTICRYTIIEGRVNSFKSAPGLPAVNLIQKTATHDKSCMTSSEETTVHTNVGIQLLRQLFPNVAIDCLAELFEKCQNNLDDTVGMLIDSGMALSEDFVVDPIVNDEPEENAQDNMLNEEVVDDGAMDVKSPLKPRKNKNKLIDEYSDVIETLKNNFRLNDDHYSDKMKKVRDTKSGKHSSTIPGIDAGVSQQLSPADDDVDDESKSSSNEEECPEEEEDEEEEDMTIVLSNKLFNQLQDKFGRVPNFGYELQVKLPISLARQLYSCTLDSICQLMEDQQQDIDRLIKEDHALAQRLQDETNQPSSPNVSLKDIMDHEMALKTHEKQRNSSKESTMASKLSQQLLAERFPKLDPSTLSMILEDTNNSLDAATKLLTYAGHEPQIIEEPTSDNLTKNELTRKECILQAGAYHEVAEKLNEIKNYYFNKAKEFHNSGNHSVASFYSELFNWYSERIKKSNLMAARAILQGCEDATTLDLHFLHIAEAIQVLDLFIDESIRRLTTRKREIFIITGRGLHSVNKISKLKPAVKMHLRKRGLKFKEENPGMIGIKITRTSLLSYSCK